VSSGVFNARYNKKYTDPTNFLQLLWNTAGPLVGAMIIQLELIKEELEVDILGIPAKFKKIPAQLIDFMIKEVGKNTKEAIHFVEGHILHLNKIDNNNSKEECFQAIYPGETKEGINMPPKKAINAREDNSHMLDKAGEHNTASKIQGPLPNTQQISPAEGAAHRACHSSRTGQGGCTIHEHGVKWLAQDNPPTQLQAMEGECHQLRQTVPPVLQDNWAPQSEQPLIERTKHFYSHLNYRGSAIGHWAYQAKKEKKNK
jgi:hypothetical protein